MSSDDTPPSSTEVIVGLDVGTTTTTAVAFAIGSACMLRSSGGSRGPRSTR